MSATEAATPVLAVCLRIGDLRPEVDALSGAVTRDHLAIGMSAADEAALEHALRLAESWSGRVVAVAIGPASIEPVLREVAALGVEVVRIPEPEDPEHESPIASSAELAADEHALARAAAHALSGADLVLCGDRSADRGTGAFPSFLAHELGAEQALGLVSLTPARTGLGLVAERRLDGGWRERLSVTLPAVCSVEAAGVRVRRAPLRAALVASGQEVPVDVAATVALGSSFERSGVLRVGATRVFEPRTRLVPAPSGDDPRRRVLALTGVTTTHDPPTVVGPLAASEAADVLLDFLDRHGYLEGEVAEDLRPAGSPEHR